MASSKMTAIVAKVPPLIWLILAVVTVIAGSFMAIVFSSMNW